MVVFNRKDFEQLKGPFTITRDGRTSMAIHNEYGGTLDALSFNGSDNLWLVRSRPLEVDIVEGNDTTLDERYGLIVIRTADTIEIDLLNSYTAEDMAVELYFRARSRRPGTRTREYSTKYLLDIMSTHLTTEQILAVNERISTCSIS